VATRFYGRENGTAPGTPNVDGGWESSASPFARSPMFTTTDGGDTLGTVSGFGSTAGQDRCHRQWISRPMNSGFTFDTSVTYKAYMQCLESAANDNIRSRLCVRILSEDLSTVRHTVLAIADYSTATEWNTALRNKAFANGDAGTGSYTTVAGDRLVVEWGHNDAAGSTISGSSRWGSAGSADLGENETSTATTERPWFETSLNLTFFDVITGAGAIATAEAFGTTNVVENVGASGIASLEAFGTATIVSAVDASGIATAEAFGTTNAVLLLDPSGIASLEAHGSTTVEQAGSGTNIDPAGIATLEAFGTTNVVEVVAPSGITSLEAFGTTNVVEVVAPSGITSLEAFGTTNVVEVVAPSGIASLQAFGTANVVEVVAPSGITTLEAFGTSVLQTFLNASGIASLEVFGSATIGSVTFVDASSIATLEAFGSASLHQALTAAGIATLEAFGTAVLQVFVNATGIASLEAFGTAVVGSFTNVDPTGIASLETFGTTNVVEVVAPAGIATLETFGGVLVDTGIPPFIGDLGVVGEVAAGTYTYGYVVSTLEELGEVEP